jgi:hypothetical protein
MTIKEIIYERGTSPTDRSKVTSTRTLEKGTIKEIEIRPSAWPQCSTAPCNNLELVLNE